MARPCPDQDRAPTKRTRTTSANQCGEAAWSAPVAVSGSVGDGTAAVALDYSTRGRNEVQVVSTRADAGQTISDGTFRLSLAAHGRHGGRAGDGAITAPIVYNADAATMQVCLLTYPPPRFPCPH